MASKQTRTTLARTAATRGEAGVRLINPSLVKPNPENPRLIFRQEDLDSLQDSIKTQGILVPLTVYEDGKQFVLLDGERRWRSALKLGFARLPAIVQPKPDLLTNIMMMFAIHNARKDWDPLPTAYKLQQLEDEYMRRNGRRPLEAELAGLSSLSRGEVRRLKRLLELPANYRRELMDELEKPRNEQVITVDHVLEATRGAAALENRGVISHSQADALGQAIVSKFRSGVIKNTVDPRQLARIARAVERDEVAPGVVRRLVDRLVSDPHFSIDDAYTGSVQKSDLEHTLEQQAERLRANLIEHDSRGHELGEGLQRALNELRTVIVRLLR